ncbi:hypothetical protein V492_02437 [Pseudogymnoascus sp. VKM F-4246]|nr:hypothetical protein V492_02437 [Pseudogymnoascus sp. VKM F-4246]
MATSLKEGGGEAPEEEKLNIPSFVRITNLSGFAIPPSVLNKAWIALSYQIVNRKEAAIRTVDQNFLAFFLNQFFGFQPPSPDTAGTMTAFADKVYAANIGQNFTAGIIPDIVWQWTGYQALRAETPIGVTEGFVDLRIWVEGFENEGLSSHLPVTPYINIGTTFGQTVWGTDFLFQRMKAHHETITKIFTADPEVLQVWQDSIDTLSCKTTTDGEAPIISSTRGDLQKFVEENYRFLMQTCLNNDAQECITSMQGSDPKFPNFNNVSKLYFGLEVIPMSSQGFSRLEPIMPATKQSKPKATKNKRRRAKRKTDGVQQTEEVNSVATAQTETAEVNSGETKADGNLDVSTKENDLDSTKDEAPVTAQGLEDATATTTESGIPSMINAEKESVRNQDQTNPHVAVAVAVAGCDQDISRFTTQSEDQSTQLVRAQTISHYTTPTKDTSVSVTSFAGDNSISVTPLAADNSISVTSLAADAQISSPTIAATGTHTAKNAAPLPTATPTGDTASSQTATPAKGTTSSQMPVKDTGVLQATDPVIAQIASTTAPQSINEDRARVIAELRAQPPPPSLEEARARRASIKEERRQSIEFIRKRTSSRASALALSMASGASPDTSEAASQGNMVTSQSTNLYQVLERVPELTSDSVTVEQADMVRSKLPLSPKQPTKAASHDADDKTVTGLDHQAQHLHTVAQENVKPKRTKWIAPLPEQQEWRTVSQSAGAASFASSAPEKKRKKNRRDAVSAKPIVRSGVSVGTQTDSGVKLCSIGTQTEIGVATSIAEDLETGGGPVPSCEDESAATPPSVTSRASLQRELELTSIVEGPAFEQGCGEQSARGRLTMAAPSTPHSNLVAELRGAGVPPSALTSLSRSGLEANEATGCRQQPVGIRLEVETVTIGGVTFETPGRYGSRHRVAASMPKLELDW